MDNQIFQMTLRVALVLLIITGSLFIFFFSWNYLSPFIIALALATVLRPFIKLLNKQMRIPKPLAILMVLILFGSLMGAFAILLVAELIKGVQYLASGVPGHFSLLMTHITNEFMKLIEPIIHRADRLTEQLSMNQNRPFDEYLEIVQEKVIQSGMTILNHVFEGLGMFLAGVPSSLTTTFITLLATFFICNDWEHIARYTQRALPSYLTEKANIFHFELTRTLKGLVKAQLTLVLLSTAIICLGLYIIGASYPLTITLLAAIVDFIPYIGTGVIFLPWILYQFFSGNFEMTISLSVLYIIVVVVRQSLEPKLLADQFGVPPIILLISLFVGFQLFGAYGIILSPFVLMILQTLNKTGVIEETWFFIKGK